MNTFLSFQFIFSILIYSVFLAVEEKVVDVIIRFGELTFGSEYQDKFSEEYFQLKNIVEDFVRNE